MMLVKLFMCLALSSGFHPVVLGNGIGAPEEACGHLSTRHKIPPQDQSKNPIPYKIYLTPDHIKSGGYVTIRLRGTRPYKGFLIQVRFEGKAIGRFESLPHKIAKLLCPGDTSVTHVDPALKEELWFRWMAPPDAKTGKYEVQFSPKKLFVGITRSFLGKNNCF